jgi:CubicO group peptidase (beta-lactamase class C family)
VTPKLNAILETTLAQTGAPAIAGIVLAHDRVIAQAALGVRRLGCPAAVTPADRFHIGSNGKAMTATMIATLVQQGRLRWDSRPHEVLPGLTTHPAYNGITLEQLLRHQTGLAPFGEEADYAALPAFPADPIAQRLAFARAVLLAEPLFAPGTDFGYSNAGYTVAAALAEAVTGQDWATLMRERVFAPLGIAAGHGWPAGRDPDQPWGHRLIAGAVTPDPPEDSWLFAPAVQPAGDLHMTLGDYGRFLQMNLCALHGYETILPGDLLRRLHTPKGASGLGWMVVPLGDRRYSVHSGSTDTFLILAAVGHDSDCAIALVINFMSGDAEKALMAGFQALLAAYG